MTKKKKLQNIADNELLEMENPEAWSAAERTSNEERRTGECSLTLLSLKFYHNQRACLSLR